MTEAQSPTAQVQAPPNMAHVPAGPFRYGRRKEEVSLGEFWIDLYPVTNRDYLAYVEAHNRPAPRHWPPDGLTDAMLDLPVVNLTYAEAEAYAERLGKQLPTPAQFEKAARGTDGRKYPWGDEQLGRVTNTREAGLGDVTPVSRFEAGRSPYGCYDMAGNVLHWTRGQDEKGQRVLKGCSFREFLAASYFEFEADPGKRQECVGFRCVWRPT